MSISLTYGDLKQQIADECGDRQDLLLPLSDSKDARSPIENAIQSAISKWERVRFYFNGVIVKTPLAGPYDFSLVAGQEYYTVADWAMIPTLATIKKMWVLIAAQRYPIDIRNSSYLDDISINQATKSYPTDCAYSAEQLRYYPIPDGNYPVGIEGTQRLSALVNDADANAWTEDAYDLIRSQAKLILGREVLQDAMIAMNAQRAIYGDPTNPDERGYLNDLVAETRRREGRGKIRPSYF